jgi:ECL1/2/3 zinc binding proteins
VNRCRLHDLAPARAYPARTNSYPSYSPSSPPLTPYTRHFSSYPSATPAHEDGPDIVPRFSPTQSRPRSYFNSDPYPQSYQTPSTISTSPPSNNVYSNSHSSTALASLRELATALPRTATNASRRVPESPPRSSAGSIGRTASEVWNYIPFTSSASKTATPTPSATPGNSYSSHGTYSVSQSYGGRSREDLHSYGANHGTTVGGYGNTGGMGMDRPLPPRSGPGGYGHRPKSIDLVTPFSGH